MTTIPTDTTLERTGGRDYSGRADSFGDSPTPAVAVRGLTKRYGRGDAAVEALSDVTLSVDRGSIAGFLGANGAGKTTLLKSILGLVLPTAGTVLVDGVDVFDGEARVHGEVAAVFEGARNVYWRLTARENVTLFARLHGVPAADRDRRIDETLETVGIADAADAPAGDLSRGMKQRTAIGCALVRDAPILVLDEPTLGLDRASRSALLDLLRHLAAREGRTILLSSHDMDVIERVCDHAVVVEDGRVVADESVATLKDAFATRTCSVTIDRAVDPGYAAAVADVFETVDWRVDGERTRFDVVLPEADDVYSLVDRFRAEGLPLRSIERVEPDLGSIFASITSEDGGGG